MWELGLSLYKTSSQRWTVLKGTYEEIIRFRFHTHQEHVRPGLVWWGEAEDVAQPIECFPSIHEALDWITQHHMKPGMKCTPVMIAGQWREEDQEFRILLRYTVNSSQLGLCEILSHNKIWPWTFTKVCCSWFRSLNHSVSLMVPHSTE